MADLITIQRGNPVTIPLQFWNSTASASFNLTNYTVKFTIKKYMDVDKDDSFSIIQKDITVHTAPLSGSTALVLTSTDTTVPADRYAYDFKLASGSYMINSSAGDCEVVEIVTRR